MEQPGGQNPLQRRLRIFGLNLIVMAVSFMLYYLGFFGRVEGPLSMTNIGKTIAGLGITAKGVQIIFIVFFLISLTWNWILNLVAHFTGQRLTCTAPTKGKGFCGQLVQRRRNAGKDGWVYTCPAGHQRVEAHFHPIRKGMVANSILAVSLVCCVMFYAR